VLALAKIICGRLDVLSIVLGGGSGIKSGS
jgi:hypothetical protein